MPCRYNDGTRHCRRGAPQDGRCIGGPPAGQRCRKRRTGLSDADRLRNVIESDMTRRNGGLNMAGLRRACTDRGLSADGRRAALVGHLRQNAGVYEGDAPLMMGVDGATPAPLGTPGAAAAAAAPLMMGLDGAVPGAHLGVGPGVAPIPFPRRVARFVSLVDDMCPVRNDLGGVDSDGWEVDEPEYDELRRPDEICAPGLTYEQAIARHNLQDGDIVVVPTDWDSDQEDAFTFVGGESDYVFTHLTHREELVRYARIVFPNVNCEAAIDDALEFGRSVAQLFNDYSFFQEFDEDEYEWNWETEYARYGRYARH